MSNAERPGALNRSSRSGVVPLQGGPACRPPVELPDNFLEKEKEEPEQDPEAKHLLHLSEFSGPSFKEFDYNNDGRLDKAEVLSMLHQLKETRQDERNLWKVVFGMVIVVFTMLICIGGMSYWIADMTKETRIKGSEMKIKETGVTVQTATTESFALLSQLPSLPVQALNNIAEITFTTSDGHLHSYQKVGYRFGEDGGVEFYFAIPGTSLHISNTSAISFTSPKGKLVVTDKGATSPADDTRRSLMEQPALQARNMALQEGACIANDQHGHVCLHTFGEMMALHGRHSNGRRLSAGEMWSPDAPRRVLQEQELLQSNPSGINFAMVAGVDRGAIMQGTPAIEASEQLLAVGDLEPDQLDTTSHIRLSYEFLDRCFNYPKLAYCAVAMPNRDIIPGDLRLIYQGMKAYDNIWWFRDRVKYEKDENMMMATITYGHDTLPGRVHVIAMSADGENYLHYDEIDDEVLGVYRTNCETTPPGVGDLPTISARRLLNGDERLTKAEKIFHHQIRQKVAGFGHIHITTPEHIHLNTGLGTAGEAKRRLDQTDCVARGESPPLPPNVTYVEGQPPNPELLPSTLPLCPEAPGVFEIETMYAPAHVPYCCQVNDSNTDCVDSDMIWFAEPNETFCLQNREPSTTEVQPQGRFGHVDVKIMNGTLTWPGDIDSFCSEPAYPDRTARASLHDIFLDGNNNNSRRVLSEDINHPENIKARLNNLRASMKEIRSKINDFDYYNEAMREWRADPSNLTAVGIAQRLLREMSGESDGMEDGVPPSPNRRKLLDIDDVCEDAFLDMIDWENRQPMWTTLLDSINYDKHHFMTGNGDATDWNINSFTGHATPTHRLCVSLKTMLVDGVFNDLNLIFGKTGQVPGGGLSIAQHMHTALTFIKVGKSLLEVLHGIIAPLQDTLDDLYKVLKVLRNVPPPAVKGIIRSCRVTIGRMLANVIRPVRDGIADFENAYHSNPFYTGPLHESRTCRVGKKLKDLAELAVTFANVINTVLKPLLIVDKHCSPTAPTYATAWGCVIVQWPLSQMASYIEDMKSSMARNQGEMEVFENLMSTITDQLSVLNTVADVFDVIADFLEPISDALNHEFCLGIFGCFSIAKVLNAGGTLLDIAFSVISPILNPLTDGIADALTPPDLVSIDFPEWRNFEFPSLDFYAERFRVVMNCLRCKSTQIRTLMGHFGLGQDCFNYRAGFSYVNDQTYENYIQSEVCDDPEGMLDGFVAQVVNTFTNGQCWTSDDHTCGTVDGQSASATGRKGRRT